MRYGSVCSGIEAASVAWHPLGWKAAWLAEIEPFPAAVLTHHYPDVPNLGDMTKIATRVLSGEVEAPDVLVGGTPCQAFSVAGLRNSLDDDRGQLSISFIHLADSIDAVRRLRGTDPSVVVWENVPGVLSTKDNAFGCFLAGLAGEDSELQPSGKKWTDAGCVYGPKRTVAWRILDAQYFGVAQRRRRVFVVASARDGFDPSTILFEREGLRRDTPPSRKPWEEVTPTIRAGAPNGSPGHGQRSGDSRDELIVPVASTGDISHCRIAGGMGRQDFETETLVTHSLRGEGFEASEDGTGRGTPLVPVAQPIGIYQDSEFGVQQYDSAGTLRAGRIPEHQMVMQPVAFAQNTRDEVRLMGGDGQIVGALAAEPGMKQTCYVAQPVGFNARQDPDSWAGRTGPLDTDGGTQAVAVSLRGREGGATAELGDEVGNCLRASGGGGDKPHVLAAMQVRRLTPVECERLQAFPDFYTQIPWRNKPTEECPDGPRYKALGNSMCVNVMAWIGQRIDLYVNKGQAA